VAESARCSCPLCLSREFSQVAARKLCWRTDIGADDQPGEANFAAIQAWNAVPVYRRAIAIIGRQIDGG
jgi:membrane-bound lytic murein transglycosylase B